MRVLLLAVFMWMQVTHAAKITTQWDHATDFWHGRFEDEHRMESNDSVVHSDANLEPRHLQIWDCGPSRYALRRTCSYDFSGVGMIHPVMPVYRYRYRYIGRQVDNETVWTGIHMRDPRPIQPTLVEKSSRQDIVPESEFNQTDVQSQLDYNWDIPGCYSTGACTMSRDSRVWTVHSKRERQQQNLLWFTTAGSWLHF